MAFDWFSSVSNLLLVPGTLAAILAASVMQAGPRSGRASATFAAAGTLSPGNTAWG
jgi:hypothetical protein